MKKSKIVGLGLLALLPFAGLTAQIPGPDDDDPEKILKDNSKEKEGGLLIRANQNATHGAVVKLMDMARTAGVLSISLRRPAPVRNWRSIVARPSTRYVPRCARNCVSR